MWCLFMLLAAIIRVVVCVRTGTNVARQRSRGARTTIAWLPSVPCPPSCLSQLCSQRWALGTARCVTVDSRPATAVTVDFTHAERVQRRVLLDAVFTYSVCCAAPCSFQCAAAGCAGTPGCSFPVTPSADCSLPSMFQVIITGVVKPV
jgi:hypothetical protein